MGISDWFRKKPGITIDPVTFPSASFSSARSAILGLIRAASVEGVPQGWLSFESESDGREVCVQVDGDTVNLCDKEFDLSIVLSKAGLTEIAKKAKSLRGDQSMWEFEGATPDEIASAVDAAFIHLSGKLYSVSGEYCEA